MRDIRYSLEMIGGVPVLAAPAETDVTSADQLRRVLLAAAVILPWRQRPDPGLGRLAHRSGRPDGV